MLIFHIFSRWFDLRLQFTSTLEWMGNTNPFGIASKNWNTKCVKRCFVEFRLQWQKHHNKSLLDSCSTSPSDQATPNTTPGHKRSFGMWCWFFGRRQKKIGLSNDPPPGHKRSFGSKPGSGDQPLVTSNLFPVTGLGGRGMKRYC